MMSLPMGGDRKNASRISVGVMPPAGWHCFMSMQRLYAIPQWSVVRDVRLYPKVESTGLN